MLQFGRIDVGPSRYDMRELTFSDTVKVSKISERMNEHRLTKFLHQALDDIDTPYSMTAQERYYLLIQYLSVQRNTLLDTNVDFSRYVQTDAKEWQVSVEVDGMTVQQLNGRHVEILEELCEDVADFVAGSMSFQIVKSDIESLPDLPEPDCDRAALVSILQQRADVLSKLDGTEFNHYFALVQRANQQLQTHVRMGWDHEGITILGGTDDAPMRFRPAAAFRGVCSDVERYFAHKGTKPNQ